MLDVNNFACSYNNNLNARLFCSFMFDYLKAKRSSVWYINVRPYMG